MTAACKAIEDGDFAQARHHLNNMSMAGTSPSQVEELRQLIFRKESAATQQNLSRIGTALGVAILGYTVLSFQSPAAWGPIPWGMVVFFLLPCFVGALAGRSVTTGGPKSLKSRRFMRAFWITSLTVACYTIVGLAWTRHKMQSSDKSMDFLIFVVVAAVYGGMAGLVSGFAGSLSSTFRRAS